MFEALSELCFTASIVDAPAVIVAPVAKSPDASDKVKLPALPDAKIPKLCSVVPESFNSPKLRYLAISDASSHAPAADVSEAGVPESVLKTSPYAKSKL